MVDELHGANEGSTAHIAVVGPNGRAHAEHIALQPSKQVAELLCWHASLGWNKAQRRIGRLGDERRRRPAPRDTQEACRTVCERDGEPAQSLHAYLCGKVGALVSTCMQG